MVQMRVGAKVVGNSRENPLNIFVTIFFYSKMVMGTGMTVGKIGMAKTKQSNQKYVDNGWECIVQIGKINSRIHRE
jgi:hypothetical protein